MDPCLFCKTYETTRSGREHKTDADYICSSCVQTLLNATPDDLQRAYVKSLDAGYTDKARAIESFLILNEGVINERKAERPKRSMVRERPVRTVRSARHELRA